MNLFRKVSVQCLSNVEYENLYTTSVKRHVQVRNEIIYMHMKHQNKIHKPATAKHYATADTKSSCLWPEHTTSA